MKLNKKCNIGDQGDCNMGNLLFIIYFAVGTVIPTVLLTHAFVKKIYFVSVVGDYLVFRKFFFNKKRTVQPLGSKVIISFYAIISLLFCLLGVLYIFALSLENELGNELLPQLLKVVFVILLIIVVVRLAYEFIIIPIFCTSGQPKNTMYYNQPISTNMIQPQSNGGLIFCSQCGIRYNATASNCPNCGRK